MLELGDESEKQHAQIGMKCSNLKIDCVYTIGNQTTFTDSNIKNGIIHQHFRSKDQAYWIIKKMIKKGDKILFKGSRGMKMEKIIEGVFEDLMLYQVFTELTDVFSFLIYLNISLFARGYPQ